MSLLFAVALVVALLAANFAIGAVVARRRGYHVGGGGVRCHRGHPFTTIWHPGASFKAVRAGLLAMAALPGRDHWSVVTPVPAAELTDEGCLIAARHRDVRIP